MSMTLDDLEGLFRNARQGTRAWDGTRWVGEYGGDRAGIRAVVEALRDDWFPKGEPDFTISADEKWFLQQFNDILGDAGEKAAGDRTRESAASGLGYGQAPAADPSPAVCEWRMVGKTFANAGCEDEYLWSHEYKVCPSCGKPISFREK